jgi:hypothetical protein
VAVLGFCYLAFGVGEDALTFGEDVLIFAVTALAINALPVVLIFGIAGIAIGMRRLKDFWRD